MVEKKELLTDIIMLDLVQKWSSTDGNQCFRFQERETFDRPWIIVAFAIILGAGTVIEYFVNGSLHSLAPNILASFFIFLWWLTVPMKANEAVIERTVHELMDGIVASDANAIGADVVKSRVHYDTKGTYAIILGRCFLVLLNNGQVWEYPIEYHSSADAKGGYYVCKRTYSVSDNPEHIKAIKPEGWRGLAAKFELSDKVKLWLLVFAVVTIGGLAFGGVYWLVMRLKWWLLLLLVGYGLLYGFTEWIAKRFPGEVVKVVERIVSAPLSLMYILVGLVQPFIAIVGTYFFVSLYAFGVPAIFLTAVARAGWWALKPETIVFIALALGSVLCATYPVTKWIIRCSPLKDWGNHEYERHIEQLAYYLVHPRNMVFLLYLIYFVFLAVSGYRLIQCDGFLLSESVDAAVLKAFLVFIAYTNMRVKGKETEVEARELLQRISGLFVHDR